MFATAPCVPPQVEDVITSYFRGFHTASPRAIVPFLKEAIDVINCRGSFPQNRLPVWRDFCAQSRLSDQFLTLDCAPEVCAIVKEPDAGLQRFGAAHM